jgi:hypothetical protein
MAVFGAGSIQMNGVYTRDGQRSGKPYYITHDDMNSFVWENGEWYLIYDGDIQYRSNEDVATPDLVTSWTTDFGSPPLPVVVPETKYFFSEADLEKQAQILGRCFLRSPDSSLWQVAISNNGSLSAFKVT